MKTAIFLVFTVLFFIAGYSQQQAWQAVGADDYKQISKPNAIQANCFVDSTGTTYVSYIDSTTYGTTNFFKRIQVMKETSNGWSHVNTFEITHDPYSYTGDLVHEIYYVYDSLINGSAVLFTKYFDGTNWSTLGSFYALNTTTPPRLVLKQNQLHELYLLYYESTSSTYPTVLKWNGTNWVQAGNYIAYTANSNMLLDFDSNNDPYVYYLDALSNQYLIKKFDGTNWNTILSQVPGAASEFRIFRDSFYLSFGTSGYWGGTLFNSPSCWLYKYDGTSWNQIGGVSMNNGPFLPMNASTTIVFDSSGTIYLTGGTIWQIKNGITSQFGAVGNLYIKGTDSFYVAGVSDFYNGKVHFQKKLNNAWYEDYPLGVSPFVGGYLSTYSQPFIPNYNPLNFHQFCSGSTKLYLASSTVNAISNFTNGSWDTSYYSNWSQNYLSDQFIIQTDTGNGVYKLNRYLNSSSSSNYITLQQSTGTSWINVGGSVSTSGSYGYFVFDKYNIPYVAYVDITSFGANRIRVKKYDGSSWIDISSSAMPFFTAGPNKEPLLACDTANHIYVLYKENGGLFLQKFDGSSWIAVGSAIASIPNEEYKLGLTTAGTPVVATLTTSKKPIVRTFDGTNWITMGQSDFSFGKASDIRLVLDNDTPVVAYTDDSLKKIVVAKFNGTYWGALGSPIISRDPSSYPNLVKSGNDIYVSYFSDGLFVKKNISNTIVPLYQCMPPSVMIAGITDTYATASWGLPSQVVGYEYSLSTVNALPSGNGTFTTNQTYPAHNLQPNTTYYFFIRTICGIDTSAWAMSSFTTTNTTNISDLFLENSGLRIYPNPATNILNIEQTQTIQSQSLMLYDIYGRKVRDINFSTPSVHIDLNGLASGVYFLRNKNSINQRSFKFIKQ